MPRSCGEVAPSTGLENWLYHRSAFAATVHHWIFIVHISSAIFDRSAPDLDSCPDESLPEFAFIGRSNVGKSSLLNMLAGKGVLARVSPVPGFTKLINFFTINKTWRLVDLPGYGFAHVARADKTLFNQAVNDYLKDRPNLCCVFALLDSGLPPQKIDLEFVEWLVRNSVPFVLVFTKTDRAEPEAVQSNIAAFTAAIAGWFEKLPEIFHCSSVTGQGRGQLLGVISATLAAGPAEAEPTPPTAPLAPEVEPPFRLQVRAENVQEKSHGGKNRGKGARPW
jgi:GTP-binding protein